MRVALGQHPADLIIRGGNVLDVFTAAVHSNFDVAVNGGRIAYVGPDAQHATGPRTTIIDGSGQTLLPGFIEGHTHALDSRYSLEEWLRYVVPGGTTTVVTDRQWRTAL